MSLEHWENYYQSGALVTGPAGADGLYDQEVRQVWTEFFNTLPAQTRLLDLGCGNGAISLIARETALARGLQWEIVATDLARIDPPRFVRNGAVRLAGIDFHAGVATERLPFEDASFDAVSGHYALEYNEPVAALAQIFRVLKPGGDAQFVLQGSESTHVQMARWSMQEAELVLKQLKIFRRLHRLVTMEGATEAATRHAGEELRAGIQALKQALEQARQAGAGRILSVALDAVQKLLAARKEMRPQLVGLEVDKAEQDLRATWRWVSDVVNHARDEQGIAALRDQAIATGFTLVESMPQYHGGQPMGWLLLMHRP